MHDCVPKLICNLLSPLSTHNRNTPKSVKSFATIRNYIVKESRKKTVSYVSKSLRLKSEGEKSNNNSSSVCVFHSDFLGPRSLCAANLPAATTRSVGVFSLTRFPPLMTGAKP